jgi:chromosome segregation ATPase
VAKDLVEDAVIGKVLEDMQSPAFVQKLTAETRRYAAAQLEDPTQEVHKQLKELTQRISRTMDLASALSDPGPALRKIEELEQQRKLLTEEIARSKT